MGRKRNRAWEYICFCITSLIFLSLLSCAPINEIKKQIEAREYLLQGRKLLAKRDYEAALSKYQKVLSMSPGKTREAEAVFNMGLIYAHFEYPKKDFEKSIEFLKKLIKDYPESPLVEQSKIWVEVLQKNEELNQVIQKLKQVDIEIEERKREKGK